MVIYKSYPMKIFCRQSTYVRTQSKLETNAIQSLLKIWIRFISNWLIWNGTKRSELIHLKVNHTETVYAHKWVFGVFYIIGPLFEEKRLFEFERGFLFVLYLFRHYLYRPVLEYTVPLLFYIWYQFYCFL